jgi:hypothetical protein
LRGAVRETPMSPERVQALAARPAAVR